jgi:hypothetical protein
VGRHGLHKRLGMPHRVLGVALTDTGPAVIGSMAEPQEIRQRPAQAGSVVFPPLNELFNKPGLDPIMAPAAWRLWGDESCQQ